MKTVIAGSRGATAKQVEAAILSSGWAESTTLAISGCASGADTFGARWAESRGLPVLYMPADWDRYGKKAGYLRNKDMAKQADRVLAVWDGRSRGTWHMITIAEEMGLPVFVFRTDHE